AAADGPTPLQEPLRPGERWNQDPRLGAGDELVHDGPRGRLLVPLSSFEAPAEPVGWRSSLSRLDATFDGTARRRGLSEPLPTQAAPSRDGVPLARVSAARATEPYGEGVPLPRAVRKRSRSRPALTAGLVGLALLLTPTVALAAPIGALSAATTLSWLTALHPLASAGGAIAGAVYGMFAARGAGGERATSADVLTSVLHYGAIGGAAVYMLFDATASAFVGTATAGLMPLSAAVVTAALGRKAFEGSFSAPETTSADRIMGAFPAVAAALGISLGVAATFVAPPLASVWALRTMVATGAAAALFSAVYRRVGSPYEGPARMAKGYVLQSLMLGLALAVSNQYLFWLFAAMGAWGFGLILWTTARELWSHLPGQAAPPPPPVVTKPAPQPAPKPGEPAQPAKPGVDPKGPIPMSTDTRAGRL
ncbi:MAG: hypothetical protein KGM24_08535, partial [Elusimicrobia bacterium]|nr:hypothetical protein [Elusimicrobiota bacterium]